ncbi:CoA-binding protein [Thalassobacillus sp. CUG 92003]|uniref:CoA-binding protein n=1 Tax=Thalassobacillus sp. CUG 92003 TaxID=2736641 RepID=UPI0015E631E8
MQNPDKNTIRNGLQASKIIAVIGLSDKPHRTSYQISKAMQEAGYRIIPVNPNVDQVLGQRAYLSLLDVEDPIDIINVFRRSEFLPEIANEAKAIDAKMFWAQQGVSNEEAWANLQDSGMIVVMDMCIKVAHSVLDVK